MKIIDNANRNTVGGMEYGIPFDMQDLKRDAGETVLAMKVLTKESRGLIISVETGREIENANISDIVRPHKNAAVVLDKDNDARGLPRSDHKNIEAPRDAVYYGPGEKTYIENVHEGLLRDVSHGSAELNNPEGRERNIATTTKLTGNDEQPLREIAPGSMFKIDTAGWAGSEKKGYGLGERVDELFGMHLAGPESDNGKVCAVNLKTGTRMSLDGSVPVARIWEITLTNVDY